MHSSLSNLDNLLDDHDDYYSSQSNDGEFRVNQFEKPIQRVPVKGILLALLLLFVGLFCLTLLVVDFFKMDSMHEKRRNGTVLLSLALLTLVPGIYHVRLAWLAYLEVPGYTYDLIAAN